MYVCIQFAFWPPGISIMQQALGDDVLEPTQRYQQCNFPRMQRERRPKVQKKVQTYQGHPP